MPTLNFSEGYRQHFKVVPVVTEALRHKHYGLRHDVYCHDLGFEPVNEDGLEIDPFGSHSLHCPIRILASDHFVGVARLVLADPREPHLRQPFEDACAATLDRRLIDSERVDRSTIAEISRLAILDRYRRLKGESATAVTHSAHQEEARQQHLPCLPVALCLALLAIAQLTGIETLFLLTERSLAGSIKHLGCELTQVGSAIEHRGTRTPFMMSVSATIAGMNSHVRSFFEIIAEEVAIGFPANPDASIIDGQPGGVLLGA